MEKENEVLEIQGTAYGIITLEGAYKEIVQSDDFERMKDITQTGTSKYAYPESSKSTRYMHSIGSYHIIAKIIEKLEQKLAKYGVTISKEENEIAKIGMLLHDIGHAAYSHTLENVTGISHEQRTIDIIADPETQIHQILVKNYGEEFTNKVSQFLSDVYLEEGKVQSGVKIQNRKANLSGVLKLLISNNIDADRLDYLINDSKYAGLQSFTDINHLIDSFEVVLDHDNLIVAIPKEKLSLAEAVLFERTRNYELVYYVKESVIGDKVFEEIIKQSSKESGIDELDTNIGIEKLLRQEENIPNKEYMQITEKNLDAALEQLGRTTKNEKLAYLCDAEQTTKDYISLNTTYGEDYIKYLLKKAIPEMDIEHTAAFIDETRKIKPYKSNDKECLYVITENGVEKYEELEQKHIDLTPKKQRTVAINPEILRLELGIAKEEFDQKYSKPLQEVMQTITKPKDELELKYIINDNSVDYTNLKDAILKEFDFIEEKTMYNRDEYYDNPEEYTLLDNREILRTRHSFMEQENNELKANRVTYKRYKKKEEETNYTTRRKQEEIGETTDVTQYKAFIRQQGIDPTIVEHIVTVDNYRKILTVTVNGIKVDISFNIGCGINEIYKIPTQVASIEVKPQSNQISDRITLLEIQEFLEDKFPSLLQCKSNANAYEMMMAETMEKYDKGYIIDEDIEEYQQEHPTTTDKLKQIVHKLLERKGFGYIKKIRSVEELAQERENWGNLSEDGDSREE